MAACERCGTRGFDPQQMRVDVSSRIFVGPCCARVLELTPKVGTINPTEVDYGLEVSKHAGVRAYVAYGGLTFQFKRTTRELDEWWQGMSQSA